MKKEDFIIILLLALIVIIAIQTFQIMTIDSSILSGFEIQQSAGMVGGCQYENKKAVYRKMQTIIEKHGNFLKNQHAANDAYINDSTSGF